MGGKSDFRFWILDFGFYIGWWVHLGCGRTPGGTRG